MNLWWTYVWLGIAVFAFGLVLYHLLLRFLKSPGKKNQSGELLIRWSDQAKPTIGGIGFFVAFLVGSAFSGWLGLEALPQLPILPLVAAGCIAFLSGLYDDANNTRPLVKLISQAACALVIVFSGIEINLFDLPVADRVLTVLWIMALMNSLNMLDNMDAVTSLVATGVLVFCILAMIWLGDGDSGMMALVIAMIAVLIAFLRFNWHPSKMFMGDNGSQLLGLLLAVISIPYGWNLARGFDVLTDWITAPLTIGLVFLIPLCDTTIVSINRLSHGRSPMVGGRDHTTHNLVYCGFRDQHVAMLYGALTVINVALAYQLSFGHNNGLWMIWLSVVYMLIVFFTLFVISRRNLARGKYSYS